MNFFTRIQCGLLFALLLITSPAFAQRIVEVDPGFGTLNLAIDGDTTDTGERVDPNTVYVLQRDATYLLNGNIENRGFHLTIQAEEGDGARPILRPGTDVTGASSRAFRVRGDLTVSDLYVTHIDDIGSLQKNMFRVSADSVRIKMDNCYLDYEQQSFFRLDGRDISIWMTNSTARNSGQETNPGNGRIIDTRGNDADTIYVENNTFYSLTNAAFLPGFGGGGVVDYLWWNHNTMYNVGSAAVEIKRSREAYVTNNVIVNPGFLGDTIETDSLGNVLPDEEQFREGVFQVDSLALPGVEESSRTIVINNNNIYTDQGYLDIFAAVDGVDPFSILEPQAQAFVDAGIVQYENNLMEAVAFDNPSPLVVDYASDRRNNPDNEDPPNFAADEDDALTPGEDSYSFAYPTDSPLYTASTAGQPLGDLNWFGLEIAPPSGTPNEAGADLPQAFRIVGNYPNPFNPSTTVLYELDRPADVRLEVYDPLGRRVQVLTQQLQPAGQYEADFDAVGLPSGLYWVRLKTGNTVATHSMVLLK